LLETRSWPAEEAQRKKGKREGKGTFSFSDRREKKGMSLFHGPEKRGNVPFFLWKFSADSGNKRYEIHVIGAGTVDAGEMKLRPG